MKRPSRLLFAIMIAALSALSWAQQAPAAPPASNTLVGTWLVTVEGLPETRTLIIANEAATESGTTLGARYGITGKGQGPIATAKAIVRSGAARQLSFVTQADSVVLADEQPDGSFAGQFTFKNGSVKSVLIARTAAAATKEAARAAVDPAAIQPLAPGVPPECAAFHGTWAGTWAQGGFRELYLRVVEVKFSGGKCAARYSFNDATSAVPAPYTAEIRDGTMSFVCNRSTGGTCVFKRSGNEMWASYTNPMGGTNNGVFKAVASQGK